MTPALKTVGLSKVFGRSRRIRAVADVELDLQPGRILGLVGPNGAGKTTFLRLAAGLTLPSAGHVELLGTRLGSRTPGVLSKVGVLIEEPRFYPYLSGRNNLRQTAALLGIDDPSAVDHALHAVGLSDRAGDRVSAYSLGMRQRLGLARCLLGNPRLLLLDEPTNGMDPKAVADTRRLLRARASDHGVAIVVSSHLLEGLERLCDEVAFMEDGAVVGHTELGGDSHSTARMLLRTSNDSAALAPVRATVGVTHAAITDGTLVVEVTERDVTAARLARAVADAGLELYELARLAASLEADYLRRFAGEPGVEDPS